MRFLHTAAWQLGKPFGRFEPEVRAALGEARFDAIDRIGEVAAANQVEHVIVAGDVFDTEGPEDRVIVQAVSRMQRYPCRWWLLPGNHDYARNGGLWDRVRHKASDNIILLTEPVAQEMEAGLWLLPAPLLHRHHLDDPTELFDSMETPGAKLRIGLAHGSIRDFTARGETKNQIAPDRAKRSSLDYLALGDWHGKISPCSPSPSRRIWKRGSCCFLLLSSTATISTIRPSCSTAWKRHARSCGSALHIVRSVILLRAARPRTRSRRIARSGPVSTIWRSVIGMARSRSSRAHGMPAPPKPTVFSAMSRAMP